MADTSTELLPPSLRGTMIGKEKVTGSVVGVGILGALGYGVYLALPLIAKMMVSLLSISLSAVGITVLAFIVLNKGTRSNFTLGYAVLTRKIHNMIVQRAPFDIVNYIIGCMQQRIADGKERLAHLRAANNRIKAQISKNEDTIEQRAGLAKAAERLGQLPRRDAQLRMLGGVDTANKRLKAQLDMQQKLTDTMQNGLENAQLKVEEQQEAVKLAIETNSALTEGSEAAADVMAAINGDPEKKAIFNEAMEAIAADSALKLGQIDQMMIDLKPIMNDIELGKIVDAEHGQKVLASFEETVGQIGLAPAKLPAKVVAIESATR
jgi:hypothetical protein